MSSNTVGFMKVSPRPTQADSKYAVAGSMFVVPAGQTWKISDLKIVGGSGDNSDSIKFLKTDGTSVIDDSKTLYFWVDEDPTIQGWYYADPSAGDKWETLLQPEDDEVPAGTAFLCLFNTPGAKIEYAGEVITGTEGWITIPRGVSKYGLMNNPLPYEIDLTMCKIVDGSGDNSDAIKFFKKDGTSVVDDARAYYYWVDPDPTVEGWYYADPAAGDKWETLVVEGDEVIPLGGGFLYLFNTAAAKFCFPAPAL